MFTFFLFVSIHLLAFWHPLTFANGQSGCTNFVEMWVTGIRRRSRFHKVYIIFFIRMKSHWVMSVCLSAKGIWLSCRPYCSVRLVDVLFVSIHLFAFFSASCAAVFVGFGCSALIASLQQVAKLLSQNWLIRCQLPMAFGSRHPSATWPNQSMCLSVCSSGVSLKTQFNLNDSEKWSQCCISSFWGPAK